MHPFIVDSGWYEAYWLQQAPATRGRHSVLLAEFAVRCAIAVAIVAAALHFGPHAI